jgi:putative hydrolase
MSIPFGFGMPGPNDDSNQGPFDMNALGQALQQLGQMMQSGGGDSGPVNWAVVEDVARKAVVAGGDPATSDGQREAVASAVALAELWLDVATSFPASGAAAEAWSRSEWLVNTGPAWRRIVTPIAEQVTGAVAGMAPTDLEQISGDALPEQFRQMLPEGVPPEMLQMLQPMLGMVRQLGAAAFSMQVGQALAALAAQVLAASDVGIPLADPPRTALLPGNITEFAEGLEISSSDAMMFIALRESAHQRLFVHVPWLAARVIGAVEQYARYMRVDVEQLNEAMGDIDLSDPAALQQVLSGGVLTPEDTPEQKAAVARLETLLACIEGWVDDVVQTAAADRLPSLPGLVEAMRRRRAAGGPAERTFASLVGMELRPRRLRDAHTVFAATRAQRGADARDALWSHPDLLPGPDDLDDPLGFVQSTGVVPDTLEGMGEQETNNHDGSSEETE